MALASAVPSWQVRPPHGMGYGMQIYPAAMSMDPSPNSAKPRNPFDLGDERPQIQAAIFPFVESLHGALTNMPPPVGLQPHPSLPYASALASQVSPYGVNIPAGAYMEQQSLGNPQLTRYILDFRRFVFNNLAVSQLTHNFDGLSYLQNPC
ncbi:uncharacterized protein LOC111398724 isoform X2 [Olea europaea var. sylvestris]|nr:uncharacterized protein LOC111398724 isoform X2 [Olea europaea var. sylvestris]